MMVPDGDAMVGRGVTPAGVQSHDANYLPA